MAVVHDVDVDGLLPAGKNSALRRPRDSSKSRCPVSHVIYIDDKGDGSDPASQCRKDPDSKSGRNVTRDEKHTSATMITCKGRNRLITTNNGSTSVRCQLG